MKYIRPEQLEEELKGFTRNVKVTRGAFEMDVPGRLEDMEWNHMDQMHRPYIHHTYEDGLRIACGRDFAVSLTRWARWPFFITVSDVRLKPGLYYQLMVIAGVIVLHNVISMQEESEVVRLKVEWFITSHKWLSFLHARLSRKLYRLNVRLQDEDATIRAQRFALRKKGYAFTSDPVDYFTSNLMTNNTIVPPTQGRQVIRLADVPEGKTGHHVLGVHEFISKREGEHYLVWPGICPHEGADLVKSCIHADNKVECHWHGLKFLPVRLSRAEPNATRYGYQYTLSGEEIEVVVAASQACPALPVQAESVAG